MKGFRKLNVWKRATGTEYLLLLAADLGLLEKTEYAELENATTEVKRTYLL